MKYLQILKLTRSIPILMKMETSAINITTNSIKEGLAEIRLTSDKVFYNPVQEFNRDLSIAVLSVFIEDFKDEVLTRRRRSIDKRIDEGTMSVETEVDTEVPVTILEALSATGLRSIRYAKEVPKVDKIIANDISQKAVETIKSNIIFNNVERLVETSQDDACMVMYKHKHPSKRFTAIDLDPYGCPAIFLDAAVQSVEDGGLLLVTATDMAVLAGVSADSCYAKYGAVSLKSKNCHEMALRILLQCIQSHASRYGRYIEPLLSVAVDFYIRVFVKVGTSNKLSKKCNSKLAMVHRCVGCDTTTLQPLGGYRPNPTDQRPDQMQAYLPLGPPVQEHCLHCNQRHQLGGPIWSAPLYDMPFVNQLLNHVDGNPQLFGTAKRMKGILSMIREEVHDAPLYYLQNKMFGRVHIQSMPILMLRSAILNGGYEVSFAHSARQSLKTNAPAHYVWDAVRAWAQLHPPKPDKLKSDPVANYILSQPMKNEINLTERPDANPASRREGQLRYQSNPAPFWGPGCRAAINIGSNQMAKSLRNQNKHANRKRSQKRDHTPEEESRKKFTSDFEDDSNSLSD